MTEPIIDNMDSPIKSERKIFRIDDGAPLIPLSQAAPLFGGVDPSPPTLARWASVGVRTVKLAVVHVDNRLFIIPRAVADFLRALNA